MKVKISLSRATGNAWIDNGLVVLYSLFGEGEFDHQEILGKLLQKLVVETGNVGEYYDEEEGVVKEYKKKNWVYPANVFIKATPKPEKGKRKLQNKEYFLSPPRHSLKLEFSNQKKSCDICGRQDVVAKAVMWMFPFVVATDKFANFYSGLKEGTKFCPLCALSGLAGYLGCLWRSYSKNKLHIFIFHSDLETMFRLRKTVFMPLEVENSGKTGNFPSEFVGEYLHETMLGLLLRLFMELRIQKGSLPEEGKKLLEDLMGISMKATPLTLFGFSGTVGQAFNMDSMVEFSEFRILYRLYKSWIDLFSGVEGRPDDIVKRAFSQFWVREGKGNNSIWREKIAWAVLNLRDPSVVVEDFLFQLLKSDRVSSLSFGTLDIFGLYWKEVIGMDEKFLNVLKGFGYSLGSKAKEKEDMGILYSVRNAKNLNDFFKVLNDIQFKLGLTVPDDLIKIEEGERIYGQPWIRVKTLLSIYSMNSYLRGKSQKTEEVAQ